MAISGLNEQDDLGLRAWLPRQRWYGDKSRDIERDAVEHLTTVALGSQSVTVMLVSCDFADGDRAVYFAPVIWPGLETGDASGQTPRDAFQESAFLEWLGSGFAEAREVAVPDGRLRWIPGEKSGAILAAARDGQVLGGEQSNTSVRFGDAAILKVFRKLQPGINPDPEILRFLSSHSQYRHAPVHLGTIELQRTTSPEPTVIGAMQAFVPNSGDAWTWLLGELRTVEDGTIERLLPQVALLAQRTADLHLALAMGSDDPAFSIEYIKAGYRERLHRRIASELRHTLDALRIRELRDDVQLSHLEHRLTSMLGNDNILDGLVLSRVHGDYHLGQVLKVSEDFVIIDFEGEPSRPFHERRDKTSVLKDVAGMLRSLDYAVATAASGESDGSGRDRLVNFGQMMRREFTGAYLESVSIRPNELVPADVEEFGTALSIFLIEKALYEVRYELDNRPHWLEIPLGALETLAAI